MTCFNFNVTGGGTATPKGAKFPGAYAATDAGFHYDIYDEKQPPYPAVGPALYRSAFAVPASPPKDRVVISPTGQGPEADAAYYKRQDAALKRQQATDAFFDAVGG